MANLSPMELYNELTTWMLDIEPHLPVAQRIGPLRQFAARYESLPLEQDVFPGWSAQVAKCLRAAADELERPQKANALTYSSSSGR